MEHERTFKLSTVDEINWLIYARLLGKEYDSEELLIRFPEEEV
jgi:hypothetical protein